MVLYCSTQPKTEARFVSGYGVGLLQARHTLKQHVTSTTLYQFLYSVLPL